MSPSRVGLSFCTKCGSQLSAGVSFCPSCGTPTGQAVSAGVKSIARVKPSHLKRNILIGVILGLLVLIVAGASYRPPSETGSQTTPAIVQSTTTPERQYDVIIKYTEMFEKDIGYNEAKEGNTYLIVTLEIHNNIDKTFGTNPLNFYVTASNVKYTLDFATYSLPDALQSVEAMKGGTVTGSIAFQVPETTTDYELHYAAPFTSFEINWVHNVAATTQQSSEQLIMESYSWNAAGGTIRLTIRNVGSVPIDASGIDVFLDGTLVKGGLGSGCKTTLTAGQACVATFNVPIGTYVTGAAYSLKLITSNGGAFSFSVIAGGNS